MPPLDPEEARRSAELAARIRARIAAEGGWLPFSAFMQAALYEPELGYYMAGGTIFGGAGDFVTAPELSPLFAGCLAAAVDALLAAAGGDEVLEIGAGSGRLAAELVAALARRGRAPRRYRIVEPSATLAGPPAQPARAGAARARPPSSGSTRRRATPGPASQSQTKSWMRCRWSAFGSRARAASRSGSWPKRAAHSGGRRDPRARSSRRRSRRCSSACRSRCRRVMCRSCGWAGPVG